MTTEKPETVAVGSDGLLAASETPRTDAKVVLCNYGEYRVPAEFARELERENAGLRLACEDWIKIANNGANKLNEAVRNADAWAKSANAADERLKVAIAAMANAYQKAAKIDHEFSRLRIAVDSLACDLNPREDEALAND